VAETPRRVTRRQVLAFRRRVGALDERLPKGRRSLRRAAWAGLQDSMPRAALLSIHARVAGTGAATWEDPSLVQVWGPRYSAYVIAAADLAVFTLGRLPREGKARRRAEETADRLDGLLGSEAMPYGEAGRALGVPPNSLRYATTTGRVLIRWDGARQPVVWTVPAPDADPGDARLELARRYLHVFGPATPGGFARWAGIPGAEGPAAFDALGRSLTPVTTPIGEAWILSRDEPALAAPPGPVAPARLLPSGDALYLLQGEDRELLVPDAVHRSLLWTSRVWPGALLVEGEVAGIWRRTQDEVTISPWRRLSGDERRAAEAEAAALPLPGAEQIVVRWDH
jgi:hypothetical protein